MPSNIEEDPNISETTPCPDPVPMSEVEESLPTNEQPPIDPGCEAINSLIHSCNVLAAQ